MIEQRDALEYYNRVRTHGAEATRRLADFAELRQATVAQEGALAPRAGILRCMADELERKPFTIVVVGEYSRGKSTLLNALLGRSDLLPTSILPTTTSVTVLAHGDDEYADVKFSDGKLESHRPLSDLARYVADGDLNAQTVDVFCNSPFLEIGIRLVDTPGLGSVNPEHGQRTREYIHNADAVIFPINTDPVISAAECNFLAVLQEYVSHFVFVVTKIDRYSSKEREESINYTTQAIRRYTGIEEPRIYPISARQYLEGLTAKNEAQMQASGFPQFVEGLDHYLIRERGKVVLHNLVRNVKPHFDDLQHGVELELKSLDLGEVELKHQLDERRTALNDAIYVEQTINERTGRESAVLAGLLQDDTDWPRFVSVVMKDEVAAELENYEWSELQQSSTRLPKFVKERIQDFLEGPMQRMTRHLVGFRKDMIDWAVETLTRMQWQIPPDLTVNAKELKWDIVVEFEAQAQMSALKKVVIINVGSTAAIILGSLLMFRGLAAVIMIGGVLAAAMIINTVLRTRSRTRVRQEVRDAVFCALDELGHRLPSVLKQEALDYLDQFRREAIRTLDNAISSVAESVRQLEAALAGDKLEAADRRIVLERQLTELNPISTMLFDTQFWAGYIRGQEE